jgi:hypothetical protein
MEGGITSFDVLMVTDGDEHGRVGIFEYYQPAENKIKSKSQPIRILLESSAEMETSCDDDAVVYFGPLL